MPELVNYRAEQAQAGLRSCVCVMTTSDAEADVQQAQKFGVGGYFQKSVIGDDFSPVLAAVGRAMDNGGIC